MAMQKPSHIRAFSLVLAFSVVVAGWLLFEYSNRQAEQLGSPLNSRQETVERGSQQLQPTPTQPAQQPSAAPNNLALTFKCEKAGRVSFSDQPCSDKERSVSITATEKELPTKNTLQQLQERVAVMEASRLEREKQYATAAPSSSPTSTPGTVPYKETMCQELDKAITIKDVQLRAPHDAMLGDYLTAERKKLTDQRYTLGC